MSNNIYADFEITLEPNEELVPTIDWLSLFKKIADRCVIKFPLKTSFDGYNHQTENYWQGIAFKVFTQHQLKEAMNLLNDLLWARAQGDPKNTYQRRQLGGAVRRITRLCPDESQMNDFIAALPKRLKENLVEEIFHVFLEVALEEGLITPEIIVYIDYTNKFYYGQIGDGSDTAITGTNKGPGMRWTRKYCSLMIASKQTKLFAGLFLTHSGQSKVPDIMRALELLQSWGFKIKRVESDREFSIL